MTPDDRLVAFLGEAPAPRASDMFGAEVMEAVERRVFLDRLLVGGAAALATTAVLWACAPVLDLTIGVLAPTLAPVTGMLALALAAVVLGGRLVGQK